MSHNSTNATRQTRLTQHMNPTNGSQAGESSMDTSGIEERAIAEGLMKDGDNCFRVLPARMLQLAREQGNIGGTTTSRKKAWEKVEVMARLMMQQIWKSTESHLARELAVEVAGQVERQLKEATDKMEVAGMALEQMVEKMQEAQGLAGEPEDGEITQNPLAVPASLSYAQALQAQSFTKAAVALQRPRHEAAIQAGDVADRRFFVRSEAESDWALSELELTKKANIAISKAMEQGEEETEIARVVAVQRLRRGRGAFFVLRSEKELDVVLSYRDEMAKNWGPTAIVEWARHEVVAEFVPITAKFDARGLGQIETDNNLGVGCINAARWIRKPEKRSPKQTVAHAILTFDKRRTANEAIRRGLVIEKRMVSIRKEVKDPQRCMKCQHYGHIAKECNSDADVCGRCAKEHPTRECVADRGEFWCAVCGTHGHAAVDRDCPVFMRKVQEREKRDRNGGYQYFVTEDPQTWTRTHEAEKEAQEPEWQAKVQGQYSQRWKVVRRGGGTGYLAGGATTQQAERGRATRQAARQGRAPTPTGPRQRTLDGFVSRSQSRAEGTGPSNTNNDDVWRRTGGWGDDMAVETGPNLFANSQ
ncbi:hypothetical protein D9757_003365 [Collybiopsis confluens]|uniref:CCHC-type domain-containing protein n=1 Tax=Collybiopsis confluens TaxID=2823264 RepID=A0A8H5MEY5_9AGAR|nr:hypothetical protein D9757_003365 [Collybiopsis confluens]